MKFSVYQLSRRGGREKNEDRMGYSYTREAGLFVLADGMGGHPEGEVAAQLALQTVSSIFQREAKPSLADPQNFLGAAVLTAHHQLIRYAADKGMLDTPRTTLVACLVQGGELHWVHCGDSRMYVVRDGDLHTRTRDHSYLEAQSQGGQIPEGVNRNLLFTCLGSTVRPMFDLGGPLRLRDGDRILLCSDGLWGSVDDEIITTTLTAMPVAEAVPSLVNLALETAGDKSDNVTVIALEWETPADSALDSVGFTETELMQDDVFASTIQAGMDSLPAELDDEAIERSIAEINAAIQRTAQKNSGG